MTPYPTTYRHLFDFRHYTTKEHCLSLDKEFLESYQGIEAVFVELVSNLVVEINAETGMSPERR
ncbi:predicted protein [Sclerotinia sclerotiorum 1980 UF-70]|uniref:Uncharacterized protein n=1 Tax=Sclerotinia sclerotiorum (strain ATCC 18683 / 1980 / Ss-1) TaxID=665079 RepID=A7F0N3_SCLS1|nr:predicted protein [Sclerotinia sclerotiorum 1980 UF-70]EDN95275.1 predicted protein [Sclerotinia sclerotiorum 1980 UF-70]